LMRPGAFPIARLLEVCSVFLKLGLVGFGGPAAHLALMRQELVVRKQWLTDEHLVDLLGATNLVPGPNSTELAIHIGYHRAGWLGLLGAGVAFILPGTLIAILLGWTYVVHGALPELEGILRGVKPVIIVIVLQAIWGLGRTVLTSVRVILVTAVSATLVLVGVHELVVLFGSGAALALWHALSSARSRTLPLASCWPLPGLLLALPLPATTAAAALPTLGTLFWIFAKIGAVLFGSGYVLLAFLRTNFVERNGWLTETQLLDAVAIGQSTPGPLFKSATFIGYLLGGIPGSLAATLGIFLPAFFFVAISGVLVPRIRRSPVLGSFLDGVNAASLALMGVVTAQLFRAAVVDLPTAALALAAAAALFWLRLHSTWLIAAGGLLGLLLSWLH
jgi:chromate transporter